MFKRIGIVTVIAALLVSLALAGTTPSSAAADGASVGVSATILRRATVTVPASLDSAEGIAADSNVECETTTQVIEEDGVTVTLITVVLGK